MVAIADKISTKCVYVHIHGYFLHLPFAKRPSFQWINRINLKIILSNFVGRNVYVHILHEAVRW